MASEVFFDLPGLHKVLGERTLWSDFLSQDAGPKKWGEPRVVLSRVDRANLMKYLPTGGWLMLVYIMFILCYVFQLVFLKGGRMGFFELSIVFAAQLSNRFIPGIRSMGFDGCLTQAAQFPAKTLVLFKKTKSNIDVFLL